MLLTEKKNTFFHLIFLLTIFLAGFILLIVLHIFFLHLIEKMDERAANQEARMLIGEHIVDELKQAESDYYRMAALTSQKEQQHLKKRIHQRVEAIRKSLLVIEKGGAVVKKFPLNLEQRNEMIRSFFYTPPEKTTFILEKIELRPKLDEFEKKADELAAMIKQRGDYRNAGDMENFFTHIRTVKAFLKQINPLFIRMTENANRLFYESSVRLTEIEKETESQKQLYAVLEILFIFGIIVSVMTLGFIIARHIVAGNKLLRNAKETVQTEYDFQIAINSILSISLQDIPLNRQLENALEVILGATALGTFGQVAVFLANEEKRELKMAVQKGMEADLECMNQPIPFGRCLCGRAAETGETQDASGDDDRYHIRHGGTPPPVNYSIPLQSGDSMLGVLVIHLKKGHRKNEREKKFLETIAHTLTGAIEKRISENELRQAKDAAEAANRTKSEFLATMSHEVRTPMNSILGMSELVAGTDLDDKQQEYIRAIRSSARSLLRLISDILDLSKIEAGQLDIDHSNFVIFDVLERIANKFSEKALRKNITFTADFDPDIPYGLAGDSKRLEQILRYLLNNALKFTEKGEICLKVTVIEEGEQEAVLKFSISDTGIGILPEKADSLFDAFTQADGSATRKYGGIGLGLTISQRLILMMGGDRITVKSEPGRGSTFSFLLPFDLKELANISVRIGAKHNYFLSDTVSDKMSPKKKEDEEDMAETIDRDELLATLKQLEECLDNLDPLGSSEITEKILGYVLPRNIEGDIRQLDILVNDYGFDEAGEILSKIIKEIGS